MPTKKGWRLIGVILLIALAIVGFRNRHVIAGWFKPKAGPTQVVTPTAVPEMAKVEPTQVVPTKAAVEGPQPAPTQATEVVVEQPKVEPTQVSQIIVVEKAEQEIICTPENTLVVASDAFGSYFTVIQVIEKLGKDYCIQYIPLSFETPEGNKINVYTEAERAEKLRSGEWDILITSGNSFSRFGDMGVAIIGVDHTKGADKVAGWQIAPTNGKRIEKYNDFKGCVIAVSDESAGHFQALALMQVAGLTTEDVELKREKDVNAAIALGLNGHADGVAAWEPNISDFTNAGAVEFVSTEWWTNISDYVIASHQANDNKSELLQKFVDDWFWALKIQTEDLEQASSIIAGWSYKDMPTNDWTYVYQGTAKDDMVFWNETIAQISLGANLILMENPEIPADEFQSYRKVWIWGDIIDASEPFDAHAMVEPKYVLESAKRQELYPTSGQLVNATYQPFISEFPPVVADELIELPTVVEHPFKNFVFKEDDVVLVEESRKQFEATGGPLVDLMKYSDAGTSILVRTGSAWPGGYGYTEQSIRAFAMKRAIAIKTALVQMGINPNRIALSAEIPPPEHRETSLESEQAPYRYAVIEVKRSSR